MLYQRHPLLLLTSLFALAACGPSATGTGNGDPDAASSDDADLGVDAAPSAEAMYVHTPDTLYIMDDRTFDLVLVGEFGLADGADINDMAVTPDGSVYGISADKLYAIDSTNGAATYIADVPGGVNVGMTFFTDGTLLATDEEGDVRQINPTTGDITEIGSFGSGYATAGDLVAVANGTMFALSDDGPRGDEFDNDELLVVDPGTGIGAIGYGRVYGCAVANNRIYAFTREVWSSRSTRRYRAAASRPARWSACTRSSSTAPASRLAPSSNSPARYGRSARTSGRPAGVVSTPSSCKIPA